MNNELLYQLALTRIPGIGDVHTKTLVKICGSASAVFHTSRRRLEKIEGIGAAKASAIKKFRDFTSCEAEISFIEKYRIKTIFINDEAYPKRLLHCYDGPALLFYRGTADLNQSKIISIVGTRNNSSYGKQVCEELVNGLKDSGALIVSGLAFGIDTIAHKAALKNNLETVAVVAHGLDRIYPEQNKTLAKQIAESGGILTDFCSGTNPDRQNFPKRNRIVAGICDAIVVIESAVKGGSIITAELADSYNKDVFAIPGRTTDTKSEGCNYLIKSNKASLITGASDLLEMMNWNTAPSKPRHIQRSLFSSLNEQEKRVASILAGKERCSIDELYLESGLSTTETANTLLMLEMQGVVQAIPGKMYRLA
ncbi:MAG: DNA-processing protein DprA [Ferruginibacter sp.]